MGVVSVCAALLDGRTPAHSRRHTAAAPRLLVLTALRAVAGFYFCCCFSFKWAPHLAWLTVWVLNSQP